MIDTHQHLLYPGQFNYRWTTDHPPLQGELELEEYRAAAQGLGIEGTVFMEVDVDAEQSANEARFFCAMAEDRSNGILGVIASCRPESDGFEAYLDSIFHPRLVGLRRVLHTQPDELSSSTLFHQNIGLLASRNLTFDLCVLPRQMPIAMELARSCPNVSFILDHCGVPDIAAGAFDPWRDYLREVSGFDNVSCKISGLPAYCQPGAVTANAIRPAVEHALHCFGWDRVLWGGDWPVCNLTSSLRQWVEVIREIVAGEDATNQYKLFSGNARRIYRLADA